MSADEGSERVGVGDVGEALALQDQENAEFEPRSGETPLPGGASAPLVDGDAERQRAAANEQEYMVLGETSTGTWMFVSDVTVPPRTRRATVLEEALKIIPGAVPELGETRRFLVIDAENAAPIPVTIEPPEPAEPVLRIGG